MKCKCSLLFRSPFLHYSALLFRAPSLCYSVRCYPHSVTLLFRTLLLCCSSKLCGLTLVQRRRVVIFSIDMICVLVANQLLPSFAFVGIFCQNCPGDPNIPRRSLAAWFLALQDRFVNKQWYTFLVAAAVLFGPWHYSVL